MSRRSQKFHNKYKRCLQRRSLSILPTYTWSFLLGLVQLTLLQKRNFSSYFFLPISEVCHNSYWREFSYGSFQLIFWWLLLFCVDFSVNDCQHGIGCDGAFVHCWMSCVNLENIDQLLPLQLLSFFCFVVCGIIRSPIVYRNAWLGN